MSRPWTLLAAAAATIALCPATAGAATVEVVDGTVVFTAAPGEANQVSAGTRVLGAPVRLGIVDDGAPLTVIGTGCTALDAHTAACGDETTTTTLPVAIELGDGDDSLFYEEAVGKRALTVSGGGGADTIRVGSGTGFDPVVLGGPGDDTLTANMNVSGTPVLRGGRGDDELRNIGDSGALLDGGSGDDALFCKCLGFRAGDPSYRLDGGKGDDAYSFAVLDASMIVPGPGFDTLDLTAAEGTGFAFSTCPRCLEQVLGSAFADVLTGDGHDQTIRAGDGNDVVTGGGGSDALHGGGGDDEIDAADGAGDTVTCGDGVDHVTADRRDRVAADCEDIARTRA